MKKSKEVKKQSRIRLFMQIILAVLFNGYLIGFLKGKIFTGNSKMICVPVLNCYSCPGALGACPIGAMQSVLGGRKNNFSFYVLGSIMLFGVLFGRLICGLMCPFGLVQDLLYKIRSPKIQIPKKIDKPMRWIKYAIGLVLVILLPIFLTNEFGIAPPYFCKWICPAGTLEGAIPLVSSNESLRSMLGFLFNWKMGILIAVIISSVFIFRPFCKYLCPLGAFYGLFNRFSFYRLNLEKSKCIRCKACERACPMNVEILKNINSTECIRCGKCKAVCPTNAIQNGYYWETNKSEAE